MGPRGRPPFPPFALLRCRPGQSVSSSWNSCDYLQTIEGAVDSAPIRGSCIVAVRVIGICVSRCRRTRRRGWRPTTRRTVFHYAATRKPAIDPDTMKYVRVTEFAMPCFAFIAPPLDKNKPIHTQIFVPVDNENSMLFDVYFSQNDSSEFSGYAHELVCGAVSISTERLSVRRKVEQLAAGSRCDGLRQLDRHRRVSRIKTSPRKNRWVASPSPQEHLGMSDIAVIDP